MQLRRFTRALVASAALTLTAAPLSSRATDVVDCSPERVRSTADRMDTRCTGVNRWFIAWRSSTNAEHMNQMIALLNSALVAGKPVKLYYDLDSSGNGILWGVEVFR